VLRKSRQDSDKTCMKSKRWLQEQGEKHFDKEPFLDRTVQSTQLWKELVMCQHNMLVSERTYSITCTEPFARPPATHLPSRPHAQAVTDTRPGLANFGFITYRQVQIISIFLLVSDHQHHPVHLLSSLKHQITIQRTRP
jgi:hypothetical protein